MKFGFAFALLVFCLIHSFCDTCSDKRVQNVPKNIEDNKIPKNDIDEIQEHNSKKLDDDKDSIEEKNITQDPQTKFSPENTHQNNPQEQSPKTVTTNDRNTTPAPQIEKDSLMRGLPNIGNTCYFNSALQALFRLGIIEENNFTTSIKNQGEEEQHMREAYTRLKDYFFNENCAKNIDKEEMVKIFNLLNKQFKLLYNQGEQADPDEIFQKFASKYISNFSEKIDESNQSMSECLLNQYVNKEFEIADLDFCVINIPSAAENNRKVDHEIKDVDTLQINENEYKLVGIVTHSGSGSSSGHWIAYILNENTKEWLKYSDSSVSIVSEMSFKESGSYYFYKKTKHI